MRVRWFGHACFLITSAAGLRILTDPFDDSLGYPPLACWADVATISHGHFDHAAVHHLQGMPRLIQTAGRLEVGGVVIRGIASFHDAQEGKRRGPNLMFHFTVDGVRVLHCGDLGHALTPRQLLQIGPVDVLMVPTGGVYTLDPFEAKSLCEQLNPSVVIPMHYKTPALSFPLAPLDEFTRLFPEEKVIRKGSDVDLDAGTIPAQQKIWVLDF